MDQTENKGGSAAGTAKIVAKEAADKVKSAARKAYGEVRGGKFSDFLSFDRLYFPSIARYLFIAIVIICCVGTVVGVLAGFFAMFSSFFGGIISMISAVLFGALGIIATRLWFELIMLGFKINENLEKIRDK